MGTLALDTWHFVETLVLGATRCFLLFFTFRGKVRAKIRSRPTPSGFESMVGRVGFEPTTLCLKGRYSTD